MTRFLEIGEGTAMAISFDPGSARPGSEILRA